MKRPIKRRDRGLLILIQHHAAQRVDQGDDRRVALPRLIPVKPDSSDISSQWMHAPIVLRSQPRGIARHRDVEHITAKHPAPEGCNRGQPGQATPNPDRSNPSIPLGECRVPALARSKHRPAANRRGEVVVTRAERDELLFLGEPSESSDERRDIHGDEIAASCALSEPGLGDRWTASRDRSIVETQELRRRTSDVNAYPRLSSRDS